MKDDGFFNISDFASRFILSNVDEYKRYEIIKSWSEVVGDKIAKYSSVVKYDKSILHVKSSDPMWVSELQLSKDKVLEKYRKQFPKFYFNDLKVFFDKKSPQNMSEERYQKMMKESAELYRSKKKSRLDEIAPAYDIKIGIMDFIDE